MHINELLVEPDTVEDDGIELTSFSVDDELPQWMTELCSDLVGLENAVQVRMVLSLYFDELDWGGTAD